MFILNIIDAKRVLEIAILNTKQPSSLYFSALLPEYCLKLGDFHNGNLVLLQAVNLKSSEILGQQSTQVNATVDLKNICHWKVIIPLSDCFSV